MEQLLLYDKSLQQASADYWAQQKTMCPFRKLLLLSVAEIETFSGRFLIGFEDASTAIESWP